MVDLTSTHWTGKERLEWREQVTAPLALFSLIFCVGASFIYYIFPRFRVFPRSILFWINIYNIIFYGYLVFKWFPGPIHDSMVVHLISNSPSCKAGLFFDNLTQIGLVACDTLLALTVFLVVKVHMDLEANKAIHRTYLAFAFGYPFVFALVAAFGFETSISNVGNPCVSGSEVGRGLFIYPCFFFLVVQIILILWSLVYVRQVLKSVHSIGSTQFPVALLIVRFLAIYFAQLYNIGATQIYILFTTTQSNAIFARYTFASHASGGALDAILLTLGNVDFINWVKMVIGKIYTKPPVRAQEMVTFRAYEPQDTRGSVQIGVQQGEEENAIVKEVIIQ